MAGVDPAIGAIPLHRKPADIRQVLRTSLEPLQRQAEGYDVALSVRVDDEVPGAVPMDRNKIAWAVAALVGNALRYVRHGSRNMTGGSIGVHAMFDRVAGAIDIEVQDDGPGIPPERLKMLFDEESAAKAGALGLMMVRDVVAAHGGNVVVTSETNSLARGTTVRIMLPASA